MATEFPLLSIRHPMSHDVVDNPVQFSGVGVGFEGQFDIRILDGNGNELAAEHFFAGGMGVWANLQRSISLDSTPTTFGGTLELSTQAGDGAEVESVHIVFGEKLIADFIGCRIHEVQAGQTLSAIALEHYGDASKFTRIFEANRDQLANPNVIQPGQLLRIPVSA